MCMRRMFALAVSVCVLVAVFGLAGCGGGGGATQFRVAQLSPSQGSVDVLIDGNDTGNANYGAATAYFSIHSGSRHIQIEPSGSASPFIDQNLNFSGGTNSTMFIIGQAPNVEGVTVKDQSTAPASGDFAIRVVNAAPSMGSADVYIVPTGTSISGVTPTVSALALQSVSPYTSFAAGSFQVYFTIPSTKFSLTTPTTISLTNGQVRTLAVFDASGGGYSTVTLADLN